MRSIDPTYERSRILAGIGAALFVAYALSQVWDLVTSPQEYVLFGILIVSASTIATMCLWFALKGHVPESRATMRAGCAMGFVAGLIALVAGIALPLVLFPTANQGPLFGILIAGPIAGVLGTVAGVALAKWRRRVVVK
jgi:hypothetical protein